MDKTIKSRDGRNFKVDVIDKDGKIEFLVKDGSTEIGHLVVDKEEKEEDHLSIKDAYINTSHRGQGLWKSLMIFAKDIVEDMGFAGLFSAGQFRRPASNKSWLGIPNRIERVDPRTRKINYYLEMKMEMKHIKMFENFGVDEMDKLDKRMKELESRGFRQDRVGMRNDELPGSLLFHQIEEPSDEEWEEFLSEIDAKISK